jgi:hypothetical protein
LWLLNYNLQSTHTLPYDTHNFFYYQHILQSFSVKSFPEKYYASFTKNILMFACFYKQRGPQVTGTNKYPVSKWFKNMYDTFIQVNIQRHLIVCTHTRKCRVKQHIEAVHSHNFWIPLRSMCCKQMDIPHKFTKWS